MIVNLLEGKKKGDFWQITNQQKNEGALQSESDLTTGALRLCLRQRKSFSWRALRKKTKLLLRKI